MSAEHQPENPAEGTALDYASRGWPVLPLHDVTSGKCSCGNSSCSSPGKHPYTQRGWKDATTDPQRIGEWWACWPTANIGISTKHLVVLDVDIKAGRNGRESLKKLTDEHGALPDTPEVETGSGGGHIYLKPPTGVEISCSTGKLGPGLDVRARGGYVVAPPSLHASGEHYAWLVHPDEAEIAEAPAWLIERLQRASAEKSGAQQEGTSGSTLPPTEHRRAMSALAAIPPETRDIWMRAGMAVKTALGEQGFALWDAWSRTTSLGNYDGSTQQAQWNSFAPGERSDQVSESSLWYLARQYGWVEPESKQPPGQPGDGAVTRCLADVEAEEVEWIWPGRLARGKPTLLAGDPGLGKTWAALDVAACISSGRPLPTGEVYGPGSIIIVTAEDDAADTLRPRLEAAGADLARIHVLDGIIEKGKERSFSLADIPQLAKKIDEIGDVVLVIIDPISAYMGEGTDSHRNTDVRFLLGPLSQLAQRTRVALLAITHLSKGNVGSALHRSIGSIAFIAAARVGLLVAKDPDDPERRVLAPTKGNLARTEGLGLVYTITGDPPRLEWLGPDERTADELLGNGNGGGGSSAKSPSKRAIARDLILNLLANGPVPATEVEEAAVLKGIGKRTLSDAKRDVGARSFREGDVWYWTLEPEETPGSEGRPEQGPEPDGQPQAAEHADAQQEPEPGEAVREEEVDDAGARGESVGATVQGPGTVQACNLASLPCNPPQDPLEGGSGAESVEEGPEAKDASAATFPEAETKPARGRKRTSEAPKGSPRASKRRKKPRLQGCNLARGGEPATLEGRVGAPSHGALDQAGPPPDPPQDQEKGEAVL